MKERESRITILSGSEKWIGGNNNIKRGKEFFDDNVHEKEKKKS